uniref:AT-hook motif nuclear-localized protein n=1 Tax=Kalanchoe fedtschenkoi TaxID=63787 RepID=A0A7N0T2F1_KALFE
MDRREAMGLSGSGPYYVQRGIASGQQSGLQGLQHMSNQNMQFQSNMGVASSMDSLQIEPISTASTHSIDASPPSTLPQKKRGRPRKYGPDRGVSLALITSPSVPKAAAASTASSSEQKRGRGRPPGSGRKHQAATLGASMTSSAGTGFTPHVITISVGEDITTKIMSFSQQGPRVVCILSASGSVSTATLAQPSTSGGTLTYEGRFEIICLTGSYLLTDIDGSRKRSGGLSVSLASPDGRVIGGGVGGMLIAASPVQVIVGSFLWGNSKAKKSSSIEAQENTTDSDRHGVDHPITPGSIHSSQSLTPNSSMGGWPHMRPVDMRDAHADIDLMRE